MEIIGILKESSYCAIAAAVVATIVVLAISTRYSLRYLFNIRTADRASCEAKLCDDNTEDASERTVDTSALDAAGNEGDDELDGDEDAVVYNELGQQISGKFISPRYPDPVDYCEHIQGEIKRVKQSVATKSIEKSLSEQQLEEEREVQRQQLGEIFRLMQEQQDRFGIQTMDDMQEQMKLYSI